MLASPAVPATAQRIWERLGLPGAVTDQRVPATALGRLPRRARRRQGRAAVPAHQGVSDVRCPTGSTPLPRLTTSGSGRRRRRRSTRPRRRGVDDDRRRLRPGRRRSAPLDIAAARRVYATVGLHPHEARHGVDTIVDLVAARHRRRRRVRARLLLRPLAARRPARRVRRPDRPRPRAPACRSWSTPATRGTTRSTCSTPTACRSGSSSTASPAAPTRPGGPSTAAPSSASRGSSRSRAPPTSARRPRLVPADRLLIETDSPYLAPVPHRGKLNRPAWVPLVGAVPRRAPRCAGGEHSPSDGGERHGRRSRAPARLARFGTATPDTDMNRSTSETRRPGSWPPGAGQRDHPRCPADHLVGEPRRGWLLVAPRTSPPSASTPGEADDAAVAAGGGVRSDGQSGAAYLEPVASVMTPATAAIVVGTTPDDLIATGPRLVPPHLGAVRTRASSTGSPAARRSPWSTSPTAGRRACTTDPRRRPCPRRAAVEPGPLPTHRRADGRADPRRVRKSDALDDALAAEDPRAARRAPPRTSTATSDRTSSPTPTPCGASPTSPASAPATTSSRSAPGSAR